jgi:hypothetical protein
MSRSASARTAGNSSDEGIGEVVRGIGTTVRDAAGTIAQRAPDAIATSGETIDRTLGRINQQPSDNLLLGTVFSAGVGVGLLLARASRLLIALALAPAFLFGGILIGRRADPRTRVQPERRTRSSS